MVTMTSLNVFMKMKYSLAVRCPRWLAVVSSFFSFFLSFALSCILSAFSALPSTGSCVEVESIHLGVPNLSKTTTQIVSCFNISVPTTKTT